MRTAILVFPGSNREGDAARAILYMAIRYEGGDGIPDLELTNNLTLVDTTPSTAAVAAVVGYSMSKTKKILPPRKILPRLRGLDQTPIPSRHPNRPLRIGRRNSKIKNSAPPNSASQHET